MDDKYDVCAEYRANTKQCDKAKQNGGEMGEIWFLVHVQVE